MKFHEFGDKAKPPIMLIHGGGNSWWNYLRQAHVLSQNYHVILPALDGHGEEYAIPGLLWQSFAFWPCACSAV